MFGFREGLAYSIRAAVPATTGEAIEVPLSFMYLRVLSLLTPASAPGVSLNNLLFGEEAETILLPGAESSGLIKLSKCFTPYVSLVKLRVGPREL